MGIPFTKMHGLGNDFAVVDCRDRAWGDWAALAPRMADRRLGVGCDQVLLVGRSDRADFRMDIYNADGGRVEMCGNGIRCLARWLRERGLWAGDRVRVETLGGVVEPRFRGDRVEVDMGVPELDGRRIPVDRDGPVRDHPLGVDERVVRVTCVAVGNPHAVIFTGDAEASPVATLGPRVECHPFFPNRVNVEFVQVLAPDRLRMRVWERGAGLTPACGTGASAAVVAAAWTGRAGRSATVVLDGGELEVRWDEGTGRVLMTGPAATVFEGEWFPDS